jgi:[NiFe] hydrogenase assembly HybE family chaperone
MNRVPALEQAFRAVATRMNGLPVCNPALQVECVGFRPWEGKILGVIITPWAVNLLILPDGDPAYRELGADERQSWEFPCGHIDFLGGQGTGCGPMQTCSLFSPAFEFPDQAAAVATARAAIEGLFEPDRNAMSRRGFLTGRRAA